MYKAKKKENINMPFLNLVLKMVNGIFGDSLHGITWNPRQIHTKTRGKKNLKN